MELNPSATIVVVLSVRADCKSWTNVFPYEKKTDGRSSLSENILSSLVRICMERPECENFDAVPAMTLWNDAVKSKRPN